MGLNLNDTGIELDNEGYLLNTEGWSPQLAEYIQASSLLFIHGLYHDKLDLYQ